MLKRRKPRQGEKRESEITGEAKKDNFWLSSPYIRGLSEPVARLLRPLRINVAYQDEQWKSPLCKEIKDQLLMDKRKGVIYSIECHDCKTIFIGESLRPLDNRLKEHNRLVDVEPEKFAVAEHELTLGLKINWDGVRVIRDR